MSTESKPTYQTYNDQATELVVAVVAPLGLNKPVVIDAIINEAKQYGYHAEVIKISEFLEQLYPLEKSTYHLDRVKHLMDKGDEIREESKNNAILAMFAVLEIQKRREENRSEKWQEGKVVWIIDSLKHSEEVLELRKIYSNGFFLVATHVDRNERLDYLKSRNDSESPKRIEDLLDRDERGGVNHGQQTEKVFQYADYFIRYTGVLAKTSESVKRFFGLVFGHPYINSTFNEHAMYLAYVAGMRSGDLSRQVGAVVTKDLEILGLGANECPRFGGGLYWPLYDEESHAIQEAEKGKDHVRGEDFNHTERLRMYDEICDALGLPQNEENHKHLDSTGLSALTEYGRMVHAEMEALMSCARKGVSPVGGTLFCTTFPCHNCAKHIVAAGIRKIFYIEPYPKSKAVEMHDDSLSLDDSNSDNKVVFEPYVGVGPCRYVDLFSMGLGIGVPIQRKDKKTGKTIDFVKKYALPRLRMLPGSLSEVEKLVVAKLKEYDLGSSNRNPNGERHDTGTKDAAE
ncbi:MAG: cytidine deaminase [Verrucomicrobia bacterium]|nr:cytidine deaminase [Verrucomicrobiota bacterium]MCH8511146.1 cytidine deaminase [Kiritimatiellia bacterium]